ncbi:hypothetical protein BDQ17DRAFT_1358851 [Cyathus striatus]|nr:hypothetical protein BDQ17DRAFT_1358851 [Cyathus striatus]
MCPSPFSCLLFPVICHFLPFSSFLCWLFFFVHAYGWPDASVCFIVSFADDRAMKTYFFGGLYFVRAYDSTSLIGILWTRFFHTKYRTASIVGFVYRGGAC